MTFTEYEKVLVSENISILDAVKIMNSSSMQVLLVADKDKKLKGVVTDGDIRRALSEQVKFDKPVGSIMTVDPLTIKYPAEKERALHLMKKGDIRHVPIIDDENRIRGLVSWKDFFKNGDLTIAEKPNKVVVMAGGRGTRLDLFTRILPKPLIPIAEKPIIEHIMDNFLKNGFKHFLVSVNYKADMIKTYFSDNHHAQTIEFVQEKDFLGTAGSLILCREYLVDTFFVSNCDVIVDANLDVLFKYHKGNRNHATTLCTMRNVKIPYGVMKAKNGDLVDIVEKPEYSFVINSGIYVLEPEIVDLIPENQSMHMTDLLLKAKEVGFRVQIYPMTCSWFDVGEWGEYKRALEHMAGLGATA